MDSVPPPPTTETIQIAPPSRLATIVFDDFDPDEEAPMPTGEFVLEMPAEVEAPVDDLPELALDFPEEEEVEAPPEEEASAEPPVVGPSIPEGAVASSPPTVRRREPPRIDVPMVEGAPPKKGLALLRTQLPILIALRNARAVAIAVGLLIVVGVAYFATDFEARDAALAGTPPPPQAQEEAPAAAADAGERKQEAAPKKAGGEAAQAKGEDGDGAEEKAPAEEELHAAADGEEGDEADEAEEDEEPEGPEALAARALELAEAGEAEAALAALDEALADDPKQVTLLLAKGMVHLAAGDAAAAERVFLQVRDLDEQQVEAHLRLSALALSSGDVVEALRHVRRGLASLPKDPELHFQHGVVLEANNRPLDAVAAYEAVLGIVPKHVDAVASIARIHLLLAQPHEVVSRLGKETKADDAPPEWVELLADAHAQMMQWKQAETLYGRVARRPGVAYKRARIQLARGDTRQALPLLREAAAQDESDPEVHRDLGFVYKELGRRGDAIRSFRTYLERTADAPDRQEVEDEIHQLQR